MTESLIEVANELGATDPDIVKLARADIPPRQAIEALRQTYPYAFTVPAFDARAASPADYQSRRDEMVRAWQQETMRRVADSMTAEVLAKHGKRS